MIEQISISHPQLMFVISTRNHQKEQRMTVPCDFIFLPNTRSCFVAACSFARPISCQNVLTPRCDQPYSTNKHHSLPFTISTVSWPTNNKATVITAMKARTHTKNIISIYGKPDSKPHFQTVCILKARWRKKPRNTVYTHLAIY